MVRYMQGERPEPIARRLNSDSPYRCYAGGELRVLVATYLAEGDFVHPDTLELLPRVEVRGYMDPQYEPCKKHEVYETWHVDNPCDTIELVDGQGFEWGDRSFSMAGTGSMMLMGDLRHCEEEELCTDVRKSTGSGIVSTTGGKPFRLARKKPQLLRNTCGW